MDVDLNIFSVLVFILISQCSMDPLPGKMHITCINLHICTVLCIQFQWVHDSLEMYRVLAPMVSRFFHVLVFIHSACTGCFLLCKCRGRDAQEIWLLP